MKNIYIALALTLMCVNCFGQSNQSEAVLQKFKALYNAGQPDSIFAIFSPETKERLTLDKTRAFLGQLKGSYGNVKQSVFLKDEAGFAVYKTELEKGVILLRLAIDEKQAITGILAQPYTEPAPVITNINKTKIKLPFKGEWTVFWGGDTKELNYHVAVPFQRNAFDIIITDKNNKSFKTDGKSNEDYYAFAQPITAPCDGEVVLAVDGVMDNIPGQMNQLYVPGNTVIIRTANNEYAFLAHFKQGTVKVKRGNKIKTGQLLGLCGNSGNSSEPHLHFHLQDTEDPLKATGIKCEFDKIKTGGITKTKYSPVKGDRVSNPVE